MARLAPLPYLLSLWTLTGISTALPTALEPADGTLGEAIDRALAGTGHTVLRQTGTPFPGVDEAWFATNRSRGLRSFFLPEGVHITPFEGSGDWSVELGLEALGRGSAVARQGPGRLRVEGTRVAYERGQVVEWYDNGASGLEQGFDFPERPLAAEEGALELHLRLGGSLTPAHVRATEFELIDATGARVLTVAGLFAFDADGRTLPSRFEERGTGLTIVVDDASARYPITVDPTVAGEESLLVPTRPISGEFGRDLDIAGNGAAVGTGNAVYLFARSGSGAWNVTQKIISSDSDPGRFGTAVALADDVLVVGDPLAGVFPNETGGVYVYLRDQQDGIYQQIQTLDAPEGQAGQFFGSALDVSDDWLAVGTPRLNLTGAGTNAGAVHVYPRLGNGFGQDVVLTGSNASPHLEFGAAISLRGTRLVIGAPGATGGTGRVELFALQGNPEQWTRLDTYSSLALGGLGRSVAHSHPFLLAGAPEGDSGRGGAVLLEEVSGALIERAQLSGATADENFGRSVALQGLGAGRVRGLVGAPRRDGAFARSGAVRVYEGDSNGLVAGPLLVASQPVSSAEFGGRVALHAEGALVGARFDAPDFVRSGAVHAYDLQGLSWVQVQTLTSHARDAFDHLGAAVDVVGDVAVVGAPRDDDAGLPDAGAVFVFERETGGWRQVARLTAGLDTEAGALFGSAVALHPTSGAIVVGAPGQPDGSLRPGAAFHIARTITGSFAAPRRIDPDVPLDGARFGAAVDRAGDLIAIGAPGGSGPVAGTGSVHVFTGLFFQSEVLVFDSQSAAFDDFGAELCTDGVDLWVGSPGAGADARGAVVRFRDSGGGQWSLAERLFDPSPIAAGNFGAALDLAPGQLACSAPGGAAPQVFLYPLVGGSAQLPEVFDGPAGYGRDVAVDGALLAVAADRDVFALQEVGGTWLSSALEPSDGPVQAFGPLRVSVSADAVLVGTDGHAGGGEQAGAAFLFRPTPPTPFETYGFGDGSGSPCPCGNESAPGSEEGCRNSTGSGARLVATGSASIGANDMVLRANRMPADKPCVLFVGEVPGAGAPFGDGQRLVLGATRRLDGVHVSDANGRSSWPGLNALGLWGVCDTRYFQVLYRDGAGGSPCGAAFNLTSGLRATFQP